MRTPLLFVLSLFFLSLVAAPVVSQTKTPVGKRKVSTTQAKKDVRKKSAPDAPVRVQTSPKLNTHKDPTKLTVPLCVAAFESFAGPVVKYDKEQCSLTFHRSGEVNKSVRVSLKRGVPALRVWNKSLKFKCAGFLKCVDLEKRDKRIVGARANSISIDRKGSTPLNLYTCYELLKKDCR